MTARGAKGVRDTFGLQFGLQWGILCRVKVVETEVGMKAWLFAMACICLAVGQGFAESDVAALAKAQEAHIAQRRAEEKFPRAKAFAELAQRQDYDRILARERGRLIRSGRLTTPEAEALRTARKAKLEELKALDRQIEEACAKAPEIVELDAIREANAARMEEIRINLSPKGPSETPARAGETQTE